MNKTTPPRTVPLHHLAHARTGDKGNRASISVIAYDPADWPLLVEQVTEASVARLFLRARRPRSGATCCRAWRP